MSGETFSDSTMLEIFRSEVDTHVETLTSGLLALEREPGDTSHLDEMMRGAHSIKGAARIVGIDPAVRVAHALEDGFVAAQHGRLQLRPDHVDALLRGVDFLNRIAHIAIDAATDWRPIDAEATALIAEVSGALASPQATSHPVQTKNVHSVQTGTLAKSDQPAKVIRIPLPVLLDGAAAEQARRALIDGLDSQAAVIQMDLTHTADLDAIGLAFLAAIPAQFEMNASRIELIGTGLDLQFVLHVTGVDHLYPTGGQRQS